MPNGKTPARPTHLYIGPMTYEVVYDAAEIKNISRNASDDHFGLLRTDLNKIWIDPDRPEASIKQTVLHEALHAVFWVYSIHMDHDAKTADTEEDVVAPMAFGVMEMFTRNPDLVAWVTHDHG